MRLGNVSVAGWADWVAFVGTILVFAAVYAAMGWAWNEIACRDRCAQPWPWIIYAIWPLVALSLGYYGCLGGLRILLVFHGLAAELFGWSEYDLVVKLKRKPAERSDG